LHLASRILRTGVRALTVHCRTRDMRSSVKALWDRLGDIVQLGKRRGVPVICNGDGEGWANWTAIREKTGESARGGVYDARLTLLSKAHHPS
jgi:tRNA-dihydrouridine synthase 2